MGTVFFDGNEPNPSLSPCLSLPLLGEEKEKGKGSTNKKRFKTLKIGTSETTRKAIFKKNSFNLFSYNLNRPKHIKHIDVNFLIWFIGFIEGDGYFHSRENICVKENSVRGEFQINQSITNIKLLKRIRTKLGFGYINEFEQNGFKYCSWRTSKKENIIKLIYLLNGNLILSKRQDQFEKWFLILKKAWGLKINLKSSNLIVSLNNAWFSGFCDADAGFFTNLLTNFRGSMKKDKTYYINFLTHFYITQKDELPFLDKIRTLVKAKSTISQITNGHTKTLYNQLDVHSAESTQILINYFSTFPLKGCRQIDCLRWARVHGYRSARQGHPRPPLSEKSALKLVNLILSIKEPFSFSAPRNEPLLGNKGTNKPNKPSLNRRENLKQFATNLSNSERIIFESSPLLP